MAQGVQEFDTSTWDCQPDRIRLNVADCSMLYVDRVLRHLGLPGFHTLMVVALENRVDTTRLRRGIQNLSRQYPITTGRIRQPVDGTKPYWSMTGRIGRLHEHKFAAFDSQTVLQYAAEQLSGAGDIGHSDPLAFHLLHFADRDVFLAQYNHVLLDNSAALLMLKEVQRLGNDCQKNEAVPRSQLIRQHLKQLPRALRRETARKTIAEWRQSWTGGVAMLSSSNAPHRQPVHFRILRRSLDVEQTTAITGFARKACGVPSVSMVLLAAAFRAVVRLNGDPDHQKKLSAAIGVDLGLRRGSQPIFENFVSLLPISTRAGDTGDLSRLSQQLSHRMMSLLTDRLDLGVLHWINVFRRRPRHAAWVIEPALRTGLSFWYGYFGSQTTHLTELAGATIADLFYVGPTWSPMGLTLLVNLFRGRLSLQATYLSECVPDQLASQFLDGIVGDVMSSVLRDV